ncbi:MAG: DUF4399 domain-containing protein [Bdellovibrio sp.]|nr:MAG: DUF4399 domain-containing protein [Bdellovibrio sp.]
MKRSIFALTLLLSAPAFAHKVFFIEPKDGAVVTSPVHFKFGFEGVKVRPAGTDINVRDAGHFHILINQGPYPKAKVIPKDATHIHYGKGQTEATLNLKPGKYTLTLQFADGLHRSYGKHVSQTIHITVKK